MTDEQKQKECERICGESAKRCIHVMAPELCPILKDEWMRTKRKPLS